METLTLTPQAPLRSAGSHAETESGAAVTATDFAALLALELELPPEAAAIVADELTPAAADAGPSTGEDPALLVTALPVDALASLQLPAMPLAPATPLQAAITTTVTNATPSAAAAGRAQAASVAEIPGAAAAAKTAADGNALPVAAAATREIQEIVLPETAAAPAVPVAPSLPEHLASTWSTGAMAQAGPAVAAALPRVAVPVNQPGWSEAFSQRVLLMAGQQQSSAELHLNPPELGPVSITLSLENDLANVFFSSPLVPVREAIENALPTLREALGQAGIQLGETGVSAESFRRDAGGAEQQGRGAAATGKEAEQALPQGTPRTLPLGRLGLVDTFA